MTRDIPWTPSRYDSPQPSSHLSNEILFQDGFDEMGKCPNHVVTPYSMWIQWPKRIYFHLPPTSFHRYLLSSVGWINKEHHSSTEVTTSTLTYTTLWMMSVAYWAMVNHLKAPAITKTYGNSSFMLLLTWYDVLMTPVASNQAAPWDFISSMQRTSQEQSHVSTDTVFADVTAWGDGIHAYMHTYIITLLVYLKTLRPGYSGSWGHLWFGWGRFGT